MRADVHTESGVRRVVDRLFKALKENDLDKAMSCFAREEDVVMFGMGSGEVYRGPARLKGGLMFSELANAEELRTQFNWINISGEAGMAWVSAGLQINMTVQGKAKNKEVRFSAVLGKLIGEWQISLLHLSLPAGK